MPILEATYDPSWAAVRLVVDGGMWPSPVAQIRVERSAPGAATIPVRGAEDLWVVGGFWVGTDHEMPLNTSVQYTVFGFDEYGDLVGQGSANVSTTGSTDRDLFLKAPGRPDATRNVLFREVGDVSSETRGAAYQVHRGGAIAQWSGSNTESLSIVVATQSAVEASLLESLLRTARVVLIQHGAQEPELRPGWYLVQNWSRENPAQKGYRIYPVRNYSLSLIATDMPAGYGVQSTGTTWGGVLTEYDTWQDVIDGNSTWFDLLQGA